MFGINELVMYSRVEDDGFDDVKITEQIPIKARVQKHRLTTREQSNSYEVGATTTYFTTMNFLDYRKGDRLEYLDETYVISEINKQPNISGNGFLYYILKGEYVF